jgi:hypothetical protein
VTWGKQLYFASEGRHGEDFFTRKIRQLRPGANPWSRVSEASMLTTRPPKLLTLSHLHRWIGMKCNWDWECWGIGMGKGLARKIARANRKRRVMWWGWVQVQVQVEKQAVEGSDPHGGHGYVCEGGAALFRGWEGWANLFLYEYPNILNPSYTSYLLAPKGGTDSVPKHWHINYRCQWITQKKARNIQKMTKDLNQEYLKYMYCLCKKMHMVAGTLQVLA